MGKAPYMVVMGGHCFSCHEDYEGSGHNCAEQAAAFQENREPARTACADKCPLDAQRMNPKNRVVRQVFPIDVDYLAAKEISYAEVRVYKTEKEMQAAISAEVVPVPTPIDTVMAYTDCDAGNRYRAVVYFSEEFLDAATMAHEAVHVASGYFDRVLGIPKVDMTAGPATAEEEQFAEAVGTLVARLGMFLKK